ncbi:FapA family protein [Gammaproteobacteria bacterium AB-CW1]|uniref:FapA family protein n=1 Tax=Natronospira elongata TaxID=3110268 RepID=A0AAP6JGK0_9GAMM|nr:FapA family protein [Gammaproteobacteria bacterium AB-CW1]
MDESDEIDSDPRIQFRTDQTRKELLASNKQPLGEMTLAKLNEAIATAGHGDCQLQSKQLNTFLKEAKTGTVSNFPIGLLADGEVNLRIDKDGLQAWLRVSAPAGGVPVTLEEVLDLLRAESLEEGVDLERVKNIVQRADGEDHLIAEGRAPENGHDAWFEPLVPHMVDRRPRIDDSERADFRDLGGVITVERGQPLLRRHPPTEGTAGVDVTGLPIPAKAGKDQRLKAGKRGVEISADDPDVLVASIDGQPIWKGDSVTVSPALDLDAVDLSTGNIDFNGSVRVRGEIAHGMRVRARDDIIVSGTVDGAHLDAGGDIVIRGGVIGQRRRGRVDFNAVIQCEGSVEARFVEHALIRCGGDLMVRDLIAHSEVEAGPKLVVGARGTRKGHILGGRYDAYEVIRAVQLGGPSGAESSLRVGNAFRLKKTIRRLERRLTQAELPPEEVDDLRERLSKLNALARRLQEDACIAAKDVVFAKVCMQIGSVSRQFTQESPAGTYRRRQNRIDVDTNA